MIPKDFWDKLLEATYGAPSVPEDWEHEAYGQWELDEMSDDEIVKELIGE